MNYTVKLKGSLETPEIWVKNGFGKTAKQIQVDGINNYDEYVELRRKDIPESWEMSKYHIERIETSKR
jgi:uncharacterized short protein YbdD (DUF466 family)